MDEQLRWVRPPMQDRSQKTLERILVAAEALIIEVGFEKATIAEIGKRADSSVGAFYARFADKDALLRCLVDRFVNEAEATIDAAMRPERWGDMSIAELCASLLTFLADVLDDRRLFLVALSKAAMDDASLADFRGALSMHAATALERLVAAREIAIRGQEIPVAMRVVSWVCVSVLEASCLQTQATLGGVPRDIFINEMSQMIVAYLGIDQGQRL